MAKRGRPRKKSYSSLDPNLSNGIIAILLIIFSIILFLSFYDKAGVVGIFLNDIFSFLFGKWIKFTVPAIIIIFSSYMIKDKENNYKTRQIIGSLLFFLSLAGILHLNFGLDEMWSKSLNGEGGGFFGMSAWFIKNLFSDGLSSEKLFINNFASYTVFVGFGIISLFLIFTPSVKMFIAFYKTILSFFTTAALLFLKILKKLFIPTVRDKQVEEYEDDEEYEDEEDEDEKYEDEEDEDEKYEDEEDEDEDTDDDEELEESQNKKRFFNKQNDEETETVEKTDSEDDEEDDSVWSKRVIIKKLPPLDLLIQKKSKPTSGDIKANSLIIKNTLSEFNINVDMGEIRVGPTVTQFTLKPPKGVKLTKITSLSNDLALALAAHPIRIEAPIPGKSLVGIEVPNQKTAMVTFKELMISKEFKKRSHDMMVALGKDVAGKTWFADLPKMPHMLIAGTTGSGKTVCVNTIIMSLLYENNAENLRFIMVDPKRVELTMYNGIPHLLTPVITNTQKTVNALKWTIGEMERRFEVFSKAGVRNIDSYNTRNPKKKMPHIVFVIDELADLMATAASDVEAGIIRLAQMARAVGIHLVVATQRPSVDVITGLMKANIPARVAFSVASVTDSRTILDCPGAEKLIGRGDMLFQTAELSKPVRIQGAFISEEELKNVVNYLKGDEKPDYDESIIEGNAKGGTSNMFGGASDDQDPLFDEAKQVILEAGKASASLLQRRLKVGYARAARILDEMEEAGLIGPAQGAKPREILITDEDAAQDEFLRQMQKTNDTGAEANFFDESNENEDKNEDEEDEYDDDKNDKNQGYENEDEEDERETDEENIGEEDQEEDEDTDEENPKF